MSEAAHSDQSQPDKRKSNRPGQYPPRDRNTQNRDRKPAGVSGPKSRTSRQGSGNRNRRPDNRPKITDGSLSPTEGKKTQSGPGSDFGSGNRKRRSQASRQKQTQRQDPPRENREKPAESAPGKEQQPKAAAAYQQSKKGTNIVSQKRSSRQVRQVRQRSKVPANAVKAPETLADVEKEIRALEKEISLEIRSIANISLDF